MKRNLRLSLFLLLAVTLGLAQGTARSAAVAAYKPAAMASRAKLSVSSAKIFASKSLAFGIRPCASGVKAFASAAKSLALAKPFADDLQEVLAQMNRAAGGFNSAQGEFEFKTYQKVVDDLYVQKGSIYFRRTKTGVDAAFQFTSPDDKQVVFKEGKLRIYEPKINQITEPDVSNNKASVESFLSLGFGARGDDLLKDYDVKMEGWENVDGAKTAKLELVAKNEKFRNTYHKIVLWIDPARDVILQQQFFESGGNYRLTHYTKLKINGKLPADAFNIDTSSHPKTVHPR